MSYSLKLKNCRLEKADLLKLASRFSHEPGTSLLFSGGNFKSSQRSILSLFPFESIHIKGNSGFRSHQNGNLQAETGNPWDILKKIIGPLVLGEYPRWVGYLAYEMGAFSDQEKQLPFYPSSIPDAFFQRHALTLIVDHQNQMSIVWIDEEGIPFLSEFQRNWIEQLISLEGPRIEEYTQNEIGSLELSQPLETYEAYAQKIERAQELIRSGDVYQINLSQQVVFSGTADPFHLFNRLIHLNPAPFSAYFYWPEFSLISSSPERFLRKMGNDLESMPIKGTAPRGKSHGEDQSNLQKLLASEKDKAELLMITDLTRNDLGKISFTGSIETVSLWECEAYANVFHLSSTVRSKVFPGLHSIDVIRACFPGGSITGCPKLSAIEHIAQLENRPRGIYTGSIGYLCGNGDFDFNIAIRTFLGTENQFTIQLGGAIVSDSDPRKEYEETLHKGKSIFQALGKEALCKIS